MIAPEAVARFRGDFEQLTGGVPDRLGIAVSGGPDSLALLLLAHAAYPGAVEAATVDHRLRPASTAEAAHVAAVCAARNIPHSTLPIQWDHDKAANLQARAREQRYLALKSWAAERGLRWIATGHHQDDQAETILMRLARGAGIDGLTGIRPRRQLAEGVYVVRPLLGWRRSELIAIASAAGVDPVDDPTNRSPAHDRTHFRALVQASDLLQPARIAAAARNLAAVQEVVLWAEAGAGDTAVAWDADGCRIDARLLPPELERRLLVRAIEQLRQSHGLAGSWRSDKLPGVMAAAAGQGQATIAGILLRQESPQAWRLTREPPRRS
jgi:tRNA(Ile)-lysidine synthase